MFKIVLVVTFLSTGAKVEYSQNSMENCQAMIPAVVQLYDALDRPVVVACKRITTSLSEKVSM